MFDPPDNCHHVLGAHPLRGGEEGFLIARHHLRDAVTIAHVDEDDRSKVAHAMDPAEEYHVLPDVHRRQSAACVSSRECSERLYVRHVFQFSANVRLRATASPSVP
jgi:hypothetical protein